MLIKVEGHEGLLRDSTTGYIINSSKNDYEEYIQKRNALASKELELQRQADEINTLKMQLNDIHSMLQELLQKR